MSGPSSITQPAGAGGYFHPGPGPVGSMPQLDLNFINGSSLDPSIAFTRAGTATYFDANGIMQTAATDVPRFDYGPTGGAHPLGLLMEGARTNSIIQSAMFTSWSGVNATGLANQSNAPDSNLTATKITEDTATGVHYWNPATNPALAVNVPITCSVYVKDISRRYINLALYDVVTPSNACFCDFDLFLGTAAAPSLGGLAAAAKAQIVPMANGWYRCSGTATLSTVADSGIIFRVRLENAPGVVSYTGDGASSILLWGAQVEVGAFASSYIPTTTVAATRATDNAVISSTPWWNNACGSMVTDAIYEFVGVGTGNQGILIYDDTTVNNSLTMWVQAGGATQYNALKAAGVASANQGRAMTALTSAKMAMSFDGTNMNSCHDGVALGPNASAVPISLSRLMIGRYSSSAGTSVLFGWLRRIAYYNRVLTAPEMVVATSVT